MIGARLLLAAYTCSGFAALVYEVAWARLLTLSMGHTTAAASTVTAAFMGGLGLGAALGARVAPRLTPRQALHAYALLEFLVVLTALAITFALGSLAPVLAWAYRDGESSVLFPIARLLYCLVVLLLPAAALGATFPIAVRASVGDVRHPGAAVGQLYGANTAGAALGSLGAGFLLIPTIGLFGTVAVGVAATGVSIALVLAQARHDRGEKPAPQAAPPAVGRRRRRPDAPVATRDRYGLVAVVLGLTGGATFMYEIAWTRVFSMSIGPSTYAFAATLTSFVTGLAAGSFVGAALAQRARRPAQVLAIVLGCTAIAAAGASVLVGGPWQHRLLEWLATTAPASIAVFVPGVLLVFGLTGPIAIGLGVAFPLAMEVAGAGGALLPRRLGMLYAVNTFAAVGGALTAGFVAIPLIGLQHTLLVATSCLLVAGCVVVAREWSTAREGLTGVLVLAVAAAWLVLSPPWDRALLASGAYMYTRFLPPGADAETALTAGTLLYYREGTTGTVSVRQLTGTRSLAIDGKVDASTSGDMLTQKTLAHLPLLLHPNPREVGIVGLGSGVTLGSALVHPVTAVDVVEISPEVVEASQHFVTENRRALDDPRTRLIVGDGRTHLSLSSRRYDVVISEPSNPWMAGVAALFTHEFFLAVRDRLAPGGIFCQWAHTYDISEDDLRSVVATFGSVFPHGTMWLVGRGDLLLVGANEPLDERLGNIAAGWRRPGVAADLDMVSMVEPFSLLSLFVGGPEELERYARGAPLQRDDTMALEFSGPVALHRGASGDNAANLRRLLDGRPRPATLVRAQAEASAPAWRHRAAMLFRAEAFDEAYQDYVTSLTLSPGDAGTLDGFVRAAVAARRETAAVVLLQSWMSEHASDVALPIALSKLHAARGRFTEAIEAATRARAIGPLDPAALEQLASIYADLGDVSRLDPITDAMQRQFPNRPGTLYYSASARFLRDDLPAALQLVERAIRSDAQNADASNLLGAIQGSLGNTESARTAFEASLRLDPRDSVTYANLGQLELSAGRRSVAAGLFAEALSLDPASEPARQGLAQAR